MDHSIWIGWDPREAAAFAVTRHSIVRRLSVPVPVFGLVLSDLQAQGFYTRPMERRSNVMWDVISDAPQSTEHANSRWLVPYLARDGWALFCDCDMLCRANLARVFDGLDPDKALYCVKHRHEPVGDTKMDGQQQTRYARKNWSSMMIFNVAHPANKALTIEMINTLPGRDLHRLCWLDDDLIGELSPEWNFLVGTSDPAIVPRVVHFTEGTPDLAGYENVPYADEWRAELMRWAA
jgi:hypothetical protein